MKRILTITIILGTLFLCGCGNRQTVFDEALIIGRWATGTEFWVYEDAGIGYTWDTADDVTEDEAQQYTWEMEGSRLTIMHIGEMGEVIPKDYTLKTLNSTTLEYEDNYGKYYSFERVVEQ